MAGDTFGVIAGDIRLGEDDGDDRCESMDIMEGDGKGTDAVDVAVASLKMLY